MNTSVDTLSCLAGSGGAYWVEWLVALAPKGNGATSIRWDQRSYGTVALLTEDKELTARYWGGELNCLSISDNGPAGPKRLRYGAVEPWRTGLDGKAGEGFRERESLNHRLQA